MQRLLKNTKIIANAVFDENDLDGGSDTPSPVRMPHTDFNVNSGSCLQSTTSYHDAPPSPVKPKSMFRDPILDADDLSWLDGPHTGRRK